MTDQDSFIQAINAAPEDDHLRLVYADWLDDRGGAPDPGRSELIRAQMEIEPLLATQHERDAPCPENGRIAVLNRQIRSVLTKHAQRWRKGPPCRECKSGTPSAIVQYGFVGGEHCPVCSDTGDAGGLLIPCPQCQGSGDIGDANDRGMRSECNACKGSGLRDRVEYRGGFPYRVTVPDLDLLADEEDAPCPECNNRAPDWETNVVECSRCDSAGISHVEATPSALLRAIVAHHQTVQEVVSPSHSPAEVDGAGWAWSLDRTGANSDVFKLMPGGRTVALRYKVYDSKPEAVSALGRAFVAFGRAHANSSPPA